MQKSHHGVWIDFNRIVTLRQSLASSAETQSQIHSFQKMGNRKILMTTKINIVRKRFYQSPEDEEDHEETPERGFCINVPVTNSGHGHHEQIDTFPVGKSLVVLEIFPRVP